MTDERDREEWLYTVCPACSGAGSRTESVPGRPPETASCRSCVGVGFVTFGVTGSKLDDLAYRSLVLAKLLRSLIRPRGVAAGGGWRVGLETAEPSPVHSSFESAREWLFDRLGL